MIVLTLAFLTIAAGLIVWNIRLLTARMDSHQEETRTAYYEGLDRETRIQVLEYAAEEQAKTICLMAHATKKIARSVNVSANTPFVLKNTPN